MTKTTNRRRTPITAADIQRGKRIKEARLARGWSQWDLARAVASNSQTSTSQASISNMERGVSKDPRDFMEVERILGLSQAAPQVPKLIPVPTSENAELMPVWEVLLSETGVATMANVALESIPYPSALSKIPECYAFLMFADDMRPRYRPGELLVVHPRTPARLEDGVVLRSKDGRVIVREFVKSNPSDWVVRRYGDSPAEEKWPRAEWPHCDVIWEVQRR